MAKKVITEEMLKKWLEVFFPFGYGRSNKDDDYAGQWYIGWLKVEGASMLDYPCEINLDGAGAVIVFKWWHNADTEFSNSEVSAYISGVMSVLAPELVSTYQGKDSSLVTFDFKDEDDGPRECSERGQKVIDIVKGILNKDDQEESEITDVLLDDYGNCIHVSFEGGIGAKTIVAVGQEFGDNNPSVYGDANKTTKIVFINDTHQELIEK